MVRYKVTQIITLHHSTESTRSTTRSTNTSTTSTYTSPTTATTTLPTSPTTATTTVPTSPTSCPTSVCVLLPSPVVWTQLSRTDLSQLSRQNCTELQNTLLLLYFLVIVGVTGAAEFYYCGCTGHTR